jgi:hypothetical protein
VKTELRAFVERTERATPEQFSAQYSAMLKKLQGSLSQMAETPIVSLAAQAVEERRRRDP